MTKDSVAIPVSDRPAEMWIKVISLVAVVTIPLIATIGGFLIDGQNKTNISLEKIHDTLTIYNAKLADHDGRISRNEDDIKDIDDIINSNSDRLYQLEGKHNAK